MKVNHKQTSGDEVIGFLPRQENYTEAYVPEDMGYLYCTQWTVTFCLCECMHVCVALSSCDVFPAGCKLQSDGDRNTECTRNCCYNTVSQTSL